MMKARLTSLKNFARYFSKGFAQLPSTVSVPDPQENVAVVFEDFFTTSLHIPLHLILLDILRKFQVQLHQLTPNAIVLISKFLWVVTSRGGHPTIDVFSHHYELHYQNKNIQLEGFETNFAAQFGCITFHPSRFGNHTRLTPL
jgi:hypothetical protein